MTVSIVIPCYNQAQYLHESVQSALDQTYADIEIIIVNDGSTDNTVEIASTLQQTHPDSIYILTQKNQGLSEARNSGIAMAKGNFILPLDADDRLDKHIITRCMDAMIHNNADIVYTEWQCFGEDNSIIHRKSFNKVNILYENQPAPSSLYRKNVWQSVGGYKKNMDGGYEDWEFWINAYKHNFKFFNVPEILFYYRVKKESMFTEAYKKDAYLKAKIVMNHPECYPSDRVEEAIHTIKETEHLPDLYFYSTNGISSKDQQVITIMSDYLKEHHLAEKQLLDTSNQNIGLCNLDSFEGAGSIEQLSKELRADVIVFYAPLRYAISSLRCLDKTWSDNKELIPIEGNVFKYIARSKRKDLNEKFLTYQQSDQYMQEKYHLIEHDLFRKDLHIRNLEAHINHQEQQIKYLQDELHLVYTSKSWKYTEILRKLKKFIWIRK